MQLPFELILGWRYTRASRGTRRNGFISFISGVSMLGIALGVAALIIVLSVMNGFQKEVTNRMLSVISHIEVFSPDGAALLVDVAVQVGQKVQAGERVAVIEAMKMENVLFAAADGVVGKVLAAKGESLAVDQPIVEFA